MTIIKTKTFHNSNLKLQIIHHTDLDYYSINIHRDNTNTNHDIFGMFVTLKDAITKFNQIQL